MRLPAPFRSILIFQFSSVLFFALVFLLRYVQPAADLEPYKEFSWIGAMAWYLVVLVQAFLVFLPAVTAGLTFLFSLLFLFCTNKAYFIWSKILYTLMSLVQFAYLALEVLYAYARGSYVLLVLISALLVFLLVKLAGVLRFKQEIGIEEL